MRALRIGPPTKSSALSPVVLRYGGGRPDAPAYIGRRAIVQVSELDDEEVSKLFDELGVQAVRPLMRSIGLYLVEDHGEGDGLVLASRLSAQLQPDSTGLSRRGLLQAVPDLYLRRRAYGEPFSPNDPRFPGQWFFENLRMSEAWSYTRGDPSTTAVIIDSGCDLGHKDLAAKMDPGKDVVDGDDDPSFDPSAPDGAHGTACAGLVGAATDNNEGIAGGCPECRLRCVRLLTDGEVPLSADVDAFNFAFETGAAIVSNSWGFADVIPVPKPLEEAINKVFDSGRGGLGALVLFAAGNEDREVGEEELLAVRGVLGIGAINNFDEETSFTNFGSSVDLVAPTGTLSSDISGPGGYGPGDYTSSFGGTSSACPVAAGIAGLLASVAKERTSAELYDVLIKTAKPAPFAIPDASGHDPVFGYGIIDPVAALKSAMGIEEPADTEPNPPPPPPIDEDPEHEGCGCSLPGRDTASFPAGLVTLACAFALAYSRGPCSRGRRPRGGARSPTSEREQDPCERP